MLQMLADFAVLTEYRDDGSGAAAVFFGAVGLFICGFFLLIVLVEVIIAWMAHNLLAAVPAEYRRQDPSLAWLLLIPVFNIVWNFFVWPKISESYEAYFRAHGRPQVGNANSSLAWASCICMALSLIPYAGQLCFFWCALVVLVVYLVKMFGLKSQILPRTTAA